MSDPLRSIFVTLFACFLPVIIWGQAEYTVEGFVIDDSTRATLPGAVIRIPELDQNSTTDPKGRFEFEVPEGKYRFEVSYIGYQDQNQLVEVNGEKRINLRLKPSSLTTGAVQILGEQKDANIDATQMSKVEMDVENIEKLPSLLGEVDILRTLKLLPGVRSGGNGSSGLSIRGGAPDQNLVMLDDAVIYRPSHLFGFFSVFNGAAIDDVELYKGAIPARYGGRLSSVIDVGMKKGAMDRFRASGGIGLLSSRISLQGPIKKDTTSILLAGRRTYADLLSKPFIPENSTFQGSSYHFYDLNGKFFHRFSSDDRISVSAYAGRDQFRFKDDEGSLNLKVPWGNRMASLKWGHDFNEDLSMESSFLISDYEFRFAGDQSQFGVNLYSGIRDISFKNDLFFDPHPAHTIRAGISYDKHRFTPASVDAGSGNVKFETGDLEHIHAHEGAMYLSDKIRINERLIFHPGIRFSTFHQVGPFDRYVMDELDRVIDTVSYGRGEQVASYSGWEPRMALRYRFREDFSAKASYTWNRQYLHMASISPLSLPTDVWLPSTDKVKPQIGTQYALGVYKNFLDDRLETSIELYYREMDNLVEFEPGTILENSIQANADAQLTFGSGTSYGAEFFIKKKQGSFTGWLSYTLAKSFRTFPKINDGDRYPAKYDRRHDLSLTGSFKLNEKWSVGATFVYTSGQAITLPSSRYMIEGRLVTEYGSRNSYRTKPYHRADLNVRFDPSNRKEKQDPLNGNILKVPQRINSKWVLSIYNVYNRANPYFIYFTSQGSLAKGRLNVNAEQVTLFPILPSISWEFDF